MDDPADELRRVTQRFFRKFGALSAECTPCGKPLSMGHAHALMVLLGRGELSQQTLGAELCIDKSNVARLCAKMVRAGHVKQLQSDHDGRSRLVSLTAGGARIAQEVEVASREAGLAMHHPPLAVHCRRLLGRGLHGIYSVLLEFRGTNWLLRAANRGWIAGGE